VKLIRLGATGTYVSALGLGGLSFGRETPEDEAVRIIGAYLDAGGNLIDTADIYGRGRSEEIIGAAVRQHRDEIVLMSKARFRLSPHPNDAGSSRRHLMAALDGSLRRLGTDRLDVWMLHAWDPHTPLWETLDTLNDTIRAGKVRYLGASIFAGWQLAAALGVAAETGCEPFTVVSPEYSLVTRGVERDVLPLCAAAGLAVLPWSPLGGGILAGRYRTVAERPEARRADARWNEASAQVVDAVRAVAARLGHTPAEVALAWLRGRPAVVAPIVGVRTLEQLDALLAAADLTLSDADRADLDAASTIRLGYPHDVDPENSDAPTDLGTPWRK
jgi:aryl-alcohol dehydrogenase-like predicted oxidoreductase